MKFQPDFLPGANVISRREPGSVWVNGIAHRKSVVVPWQGAVLEWAPRDAETVSASAFEAMLALSPELVIFGSGESLRFVPPVVYKALIARRIGVETMDTPAACRTYNVLAAEGRSVVAALIV